MAAPGIPEIRSFRFDADESRLSTAPATAPLDLTASDGTGLVLVALSARVVIDGPLAFTELHLTFQNPEPRQIEGRFRIGLPSNASISRFAMRIGSSWQEGEVVERQAARQAYEDFLHRKQDPALLEHEAGNEFSARVFPIEASGLKEILVSYSHELPGPDDPYRLPLVGLPTIRELDVRALLGRSEGGQVASSLGGASTSWQVVEVRKSSWKPDVDFEVKPAPGRLSALRCGDLAVVRVSPPLPVERDEISSLLVLFDTSASRALGFGRQIELLEALARGLGRGEGARLAVACFDQGVELCFEGDAGGFSSEHARAIASRRALGASDLVGALRWAAGRRGHERVLIVSDGVSTAGDTEPEQITAAVRDLAASGVGRLDAVATGGLRDDAALRRLVTAGLSRDGTVCGDGLSPAQIADRLTRATRSGLRVEIPGASWVWPARLDGVQPGDTTLVYADLPAHEPLRVLIDGKPTDAVEAGSTERALLERAWVKARIEKLEELRARPDTDRDVREGLKKQVIDLSVKHRVLSPYTALLVLETEADYARFHIDRRALADILSVGVGGLEVLHRSAPAPAPVAPPPDPRPKMKADFGSSKKMMAAPEAPASLAHDKVEEVEEIEEAEDEAPAAAMSHDGAPGGGESFSDFGAGDLGGASAEHGASADESPVLFSLRELVNVEERRIHQEEASIPSPEPAPPPPPAPAMRAPAPAAAPPPAPAPVMAPPAFARAAPVFAAAAAPPAEAPSLLRRLQNAVTDAVSGLRGAPPAPEPPRPAPPAAPEPARRPATPATPAPAAPEPPKLGPWQGPFRDVMATLLEGRRREALEQALRWRDEAPGDVLALVAIGEAAESLGDRALAARAYGSLIDLFPSRADLRRFAGERLERLAVPWALAVAIDSYRKAVASRPDHPSSHRLLGMALLRAGRIPEAFEAIAAGQARSYPPKFPGVDRILAEDLGLVAAAWIRVEPARRGEILDRISRAGARLESAPSVRFVLVWETDANDVDFHIHDSHGGHAYFSQKQLPSGGELYADITQGYGPECFTIRNSIPTRAYPYSLQAHYFSRGPMGYGMGTLQILEHDGQGRFAFDDRPYIVMEDRAYIDLGTVPGPLPIPG